MFEIINGFSSRILFYEDTLTKTSVFYFILCFYSYLYLSLFEYEAKLNFRDSWEKYCHNPCNLTIPNQLTTLFAIRIITTHVVEPYCHRYKSNFRNNSPIGANLITDRYQGGGKILIRNGILNL